MKSTTRWIALVLVVLALAPDGEARSRSVRSRGPRDQGPAAPLDPFSASQPQSVRSTHLDLDLTVDFAAKRIRGAVTHTIEQLSPADRFIVDTRDLEITGVFVDGAKAQWSLGSTTALGRPLTININPSSERVRIEYQTIPGVSALYWLEPAQTIGGISPFLFTFTQPDRGREWIPVQDTPGVRTTYHATVRVPNDLLAVMSGNNATAVDPDGVYEIDMPYSIPSYLIALAVGRLEFRSFSDRTGFYAEPELVTDAVWDMQYLPEMFDAAERVMGPYPFARYDVLVMPPAFVAGGMENPMLNFLAQGNVVPANHEVSPTPSSVLAHELAHSWSGDATTCATWSDTWLNEGFATYYSGRILEEMMGEERAELGYYFDRQNYESYAAQPGVNARYKTLHRQFVTNENLSIFNPTNYNKGSIFLKALEDGLGRERFDFILRSYFHRHAFRWADERAFIDELARWNADLAALKVEEWIYSSTLPSNVSAPTRSALWDRIGVEAQRYRAGTAVADLNRQGWTHLHLGLFLWQITDAIKPRMEELDAVLGLSSMKTPSMHWLLPVAETRYAPGLPMLERFMEVGGPNVVAIYQRLAQTTAGRTWGREIYQRVKAHYDPNTRANVERILGLTFPSLEAMERLAA
jgi:leukotriene-A4 hydrolase